MSLKSKAKKALVYFFPEQMEARDIRKNTVIQKQNYDMYSSMTEEQIASELNDFYFNLTGHKLHLEEPERFT